MNIRRLLTGPIILAIFSTGGCGTNATPCAGLFWPDASKMSPALKTALERQTTAEELSLLHQGMSMEVAVFYLSKGRSVIDPTDKPFQARDTNSGSPKTLLQAVLPGVLVSVDPWGQILYFSDDPAHAARADKISQRLRVRLETEAKLEIQRRIMTGELDLVWSYILDYESSASPIEERQQAIRVWKSAALVDVDEKPSILSRANAISKTGVASKDALHVACAISAGCAYFFTTDDHVIKRLKTLKEIKVANPVEFVVGETK